MKSTCSNCKFWLKAEREADPSICRRFPPATIKINIPDEEDKFRIIAQFPPMQSFGWCGEHRDKSLH